MKKIIAITALFSLFTAGIAFAAELSPTGGVTASDALSLYGGLNAADSAGPTSTLIGKTSKGVKIGAYYTGTGYALDTKHDSGNTEYGTAHDATAIYKKEIGAAALVAPTAASYSSFTEWTAM